MKVCLSHMTAFKWYMRNPRVKMRILRKCAPSASTAHVEFSAPSSSDVELLSRYLFGRAFDGSALDVRAFDGKGIDRRGLDASTNVIRASTNNRWVDTSLDCLVGLACNRRFVEGLNIHAIEGILPPSSFFTIGNIAHIELYIVSPELLYLQLCGAFNLEEAVFCGSALCSNYLMCSSESCGVKLRNESGGPLTSTEKLKAYLDQCRGRRGTKKANAALPYILENAYSPMELGVAMMYRMPKRLGGFGFRDVALNQEIRLKGLPSGDFTSSAVVRKPDILITVDKRGNCWMAGIDYDSSAIHTQQNRMYLDSLRRNEIAAGKKFVYFTLTNRQAMEFGAFCTLAEQVRIALGVRANTHLRVGKDTAEGIQNLEELRHRQFKLWAKVVCSSDFRQRIE